MPTIRTSEELSVTETTTFAADLVYEFVAPTNTRTVAIFLGLADLFQPAPSLINYGSISAYDPSAPAFGVSSVVSIDGRGIWRDAVIENHGTMRAVSDRGDVRTIWATSWSPSIVNTGFISADAVAGESIAVQSFAANLDWLPYSVTNSGTISAVGHRAWGLYVVSATIQNDGVISAMGGNGSAFGIVTRQSTIINSSTGSILADASSPSVRAAAIAFSSVGLNSLLDNEVFNAGLIAGDIAIAEYIDNGSQTRISNTGEIRGDIDLLSGDDVLTNSGRIQGQIDLGDGQDVYDGRGGGRVVGLIDGGLGVDLVRLTGSRQDWSFSQSGGVTTVTFAATGETLQFSAFERFRFSDGLFDAAGAPLAEPELVGSNKNDDIFGTADDDRILGLSGSDVIDGGVGDDFIDGGDDLDVAVFSGRSTSYQIDYGADRITVVGRDGTDTLVNVEALAFEDVIIQRGSSRGDRLIGTDGNDVIYGLEGDDLIDGLRGMDLLYGGGGDDVFQFSATDIINAGKGTVDGGAGTDTLDLRLIASGSVSAATSDEFLLTVGAQTYGVTDIERIIGRTSTDWRPDADVIDLRGYGRSIKLYGGGGDDVLVSGSGDDLLVGGSGRNTIDGGTGYDVSGYAGARKGYATVNSTTVVGGREGGTDTLTGIEAAAFVDGLTTFNADSQAAQLMRLYSTAFDRAPDAEGFHVQLDALEGGVSMAEMARRFMTSDEFVSRFGMLTDVQYVQRLYQNAFDRQPSNAEINDWLAYLNAGNTRQALMLVIAESAESRTATWSTLSGGLWVGDAVAESLARLFDAVFDRLPDENGLVTWRASMAGGATLLDVATAFLASAEGQARYGGLSNAQFVEAVYQAALNRAADAGGLTAYTAGLNAGTITRAQMLAEVSESAEHRALYLPNLVGGVSLQAAAPAPVESGAKIVHDEAGPQVLPGLDDDGKDAGAGPQTVPADPEASGSKDAGPQILPGLDDDAFLPMPAADAGREWAGLSARLDGDVARELPVFAAYDFLPVTPKDAGPQILPAETGLDLDALFATSPAELALEDALAALTPDPLKPAALDVEDSWHQLPAHDAFQ